MYNFFQLIIPEEVPLAEDVDFEILARFDMTGGNIKSAVFRAASRAALKGEGEQRLLLNNHSSSAERRRGCDERCRIARVAALRGGGGVMSAAE